MARLHWGGAAQPGQRPIGANNTLSHGNDIAWRGVHLVSQHEPWSTRVFSKPPFRNWAEPDAGHLGRARWMPPILIPACRASSKHLPGLLPKSNNLHMSILCALISRTEPSSLWAFASHTPCTGDTGMPGNGRGSSHPQWPATASG